MEPPAPARLSMTTAVPSALASGSAYSRAIRSTEPPAGNGTTSVTGREGHACARAASGSIDTRPAARISRRRNAAAVEMGFMERPVAGF